MNMSWPLFLLIIGGLLFIIVLTLFWPTKVGTRAVFRDDDGTGMEETCCITIPTILR